MIRRHPLPFLILALLITVIGLWQWAQLTKVIVAGPSPVWPTAGTHYERPYPVFIYGDGQTKRLSFGFFGLWVGMPPQDGALMIICNFYGISSGQSMSKQFGYVSRGMGQTFEVQAKSCADGMRVK
jgi:hypothetical protein